MRSGSSVPSSQVDLGFVGVGFLVVRRLHGNQTRNRLQVLVGGGALGWVDLQGGEWRGIGESRFRIGGKVRGNPDGALVVGFCVN